MAALPLLPGLNDKLAKDEQVTATELLRRHGFPRSALREGAAVMGAESGYRTDNDNGICCIGLMQINYKAHKGTKGIPADEGAAKEWLKDADNNVGVAYQIWKDAGGTFQRDWEARMNGRYRRFLGQNPLITVKKNTVFGSVTDTVGDAVDVVTSPLDTLGEIGSALLSPDTYFRAGKGVLGTVFIVIGVYGLVFVVARKAVNSDVGQSALGVVGATVPGGRVATSAVKSTLKR